MIKFHWYQNMAGTTPRRHKSFILAWVVPCSLLDAALWGSLSVCTVPLSKAKNVEAERVVLQHFCLQILLNFLVSIQVQDRQMLQSKNIFRKMSLRQPWPEQQPHTVPLIWFPTAGRCWGQLLIAHPQTYVLGLKWQLRCQSPWFWSGITTPQIRKGPTKSPFSWFFILALCVISVKQKCLF